MRRIMVSICSYSSDRGRDVQELIYPIPIADFQRIIGGMFEAAKRKCRDHPRLHIWVYEIRFHKPEDKVTYVAREIVSVTLTPNEGEEISMEQSKLAHSFIEKMMRATYCKRDLDEFKAAGLD